MEKLKALCKQYKEAVIGMEKAEDDLRKYAKLEEELADEYNKLSAQCIQMPIPDLCNLGKEQAEEIVRTFRAKNAVKKELLEAEKKREEVELEMKRMHFVKVSKLRNDCLFQLESMDLDVAFTSEENIDYVAYDEGELIRQDSIITEEPDQDEDSRSVQFDVPPLDRDLDKSIQNLIEFNNERVEEEKTRKKKRGKNFMNHFRTLKRKEMDQETLDLLLEEDEE